MADEKPNTKQIDQIDWMEAEAAFLRMPRRSARNLSKWILTKYGFRINPTELKPYIVKKGIAAAAIEYDKKNRVLIHEATTKALIRDIQDSKLTRLRRFEKLDDMGMTALETSLQAFVESPRMKMPSLETLKTLTGVVEKINKMRGGIEVPALPEQMEGEDVGGGANTIDGMIMALQNLKEKKLSAEELLSDDIIDVTPNKVEVEEK